jgi:hypothetical protein
MSFTNGTVLFFFAVTGVITTTSTAAAFFKTRTLVSSFLGLCVIVFGFLVTLAIPAQMIEDQIADRVGTIQLDFDKRLLAAPSDRQGLNRDVRMMDELGQIGGVVRRTEFPDALSPTPSP